MKPTKMTMANLTKAFRVWLSSEPWSINSMFRDDLLALLADHARLEAIVAKQRDLLSRVRSDIFQTARSNQCNLTGKDITFPNDAPSTSRIGMTAVHRQGIKESLQLVDEIDRLRSALAYSTEAAAGGEGDHD